MIKIKPAHLDDLEKWFLSIRDHLKKANRYAQNRVDIDALMWRYHQGLKTNNNNFVIWLILDEINGDDTHIATVVSQIVDNPLSGRTFNLWLAGGEPGRLRDWAQADTEFFEPLAAAEGCTRMSIVGRWQWQRALPGDWRETARVLERPVRHELWRQRGERSDAGADDVGFDRSAVSTLLS